MTVTTKAVLSFEAGLLVRSQARHLLERQRMLGAIDEYSEDKRLLTSTFVVKGPVGSIAALREILMEAERVLAAD